MKKIYLSILFALYALFAYPQSFSWIDSDPVNYNLNPALATFGIELDEAANRVYSTYLVTGHETFNLKVYGDMALEARDLAGNKAWDVTMGPKAHTSMVETDGAGDVYVAGAFLDTLFFTPSAFLLNTGSGFNVNFFIAKYDAAGNFVWSRNLSTTWPNATFLEDIEADHQGHVWYAITTLTTKRFAHLAEIDANGNDVQMRTIGNVITVGAMSFDPWGGLYVSGDTNPGDFIMDADTFTAPYQYNIYIARYGADGTPRWAQFGSTVTVIHSQVIADDAGNAFLSGPRYDSLSFGNQHLGKPAWLAHLFLFKTDSLGDFKWASPPAPTPGIPLGEFLVAPGWYSGTDAAGNVYIGGVQRGTLDWGNGIINATASAANYMSCFLKVDAGGQTQWVKLAGNDLYNATQSLQAAGNGDCYFTSLANDSAFYDNFFVQSGNLRNYVVGKLAPAPTAVADPVSPEHFTISPNPSSQFLVLPDILLDNPVRIYSAEGRLVYDTRALPQLRLDLGRLDNGLYLVTGQGGGRTVTARWIKAD